MQDFNNVVWEKPVSDDIGAGYQFAGLFHYSGSAPARKGLQLGDAVKDALRHGAGRFGVVFTDAVNMDFQFVGGDGRPSYRGHDWKSRPMRFTTSS